MGFSEVTGSAFLIFIKLKGAKLVIMYKKCKIKAELIHH